SSGIHGANRLGSNSLSELGVFGKVAGITATRYARRAAVAQNATLERLAQDIEHRTLSLIGADGGTERLAVLRDEMARSMEAGCGIYRVGAEMQATCDTIAALKERYRRIQLDDRSRVWNTEWLAAIELGYQLDVAEAIAHSAINRRESRGAHQRLDDFNTRDDASFLKHTLAYYRPDAPPRIDYGPVTITRSPPGKRAYGAEGERIEQTGGGASHVA
ncbi:MAG: succinate dehydrogenase/fumarate reductase flavoprotein subunit, partial [Pseudolabrys sp.]